MSLVEKLIKAMFLLCEARQEKAMANSKERTAEKEFMALYEELMEQTRKGKTIDELMKGDGQLWEYQS